MDFSNNLYDLKSKYPNVIFDSLRMSLLEKIEGQSVKSDGWSGVTDNFIICDEILNSSRELELFKFLISYPNIAIDNSTCVDGYSAAHKIKSIKIPLNYQKIDGFINTMEAVLLSPGTLFKEFITNDNMVIEFAG